MREAIKLINLLFLFIPVFGMSQKTWVKGDTLKSSAGYTYTIVSPDTIIADSKLYRLLNTDTLPTSRTTPKSFDYYNGTLWFDGWVNETVKGKVEIPINVMDSGLKVEVVETRDTVYRCPYHYNYNVQYFNNNGEIENHNKSDNCKLDKIITVRRYKLYVINEYGQKEYLSMELSKVK